MRTEFPRVYHQTKGYRGSMYVCGIALAGGALIGGGYVLAMEDSSGALPALVVFGCVIVLLGGIAMLVSGARTRVVLHADAIEIYGVFRATRLTSAEIGGRRAKAMENGGPVISLLRHDPEGDSIDLPQSLSTDSEFQAWFADIPDVDAKERQASLDEYLRDDSAPGSADEKIEQLRSAQRVSRYFAWISIAAFLWVIAYPHPYDLAIVTALVLPWVAIALAAFRGSIYRLDTKPNDVRINLFPTLVMPGGALMLRAVLDIDLLDWARAAWMTAAGAIAGIGLCVVLVRELRAQWASQFFLLLLAIPYAYGAVVLGNMKFDHGEPVRFQTRVLDVHVDTSSGRRFNLRLAPWGPRLEPEDVDAGRALYERTAKGDVVCVYVYRGALAIRWFEVWDCPGKT